ncbi:hypothetical protein CFP56_016111 [Quercus suber]|uniref:Uncharacterized protein n=1 Tax=Quercus suber TaxID=58331 RepID=A0AAW0KPK1_QUESU
MANVIELALQSLEDQRILYSSDKLIHVICSSKLFIERCLQLEHGLCGGLQAKRETPPEKYDQVGSTSFRLLARCTSSHENEWRIR